VKFVPPYFFNEASCFNVTIEWTPLFIFTCETAAPHVRINAFINTASRCRLSVITGSGTLLYSLVGLLIAGDTKGDAKFNYFKVVGESRPLIGAVVVLLQTEFRMAESD
jgi:hypothetical protein